MPHACSSLILYCIDFRFGREIKKFLEDKKLLGDVDIVSLAGAVKNIVEPQSPSDVDFVLRQIEISWRLHNIKTVYLMNHIDCGAYGGRAAFASEKAERERHLADLKKASEVIKQKFTDLQTRLILANINDSRIWFEEIET